MTVDELKEIVERVCGHVSKWRMPDDWDGSKEHIRFRINDHLNIKTLMALSQALGTEEINFNFGYEGSPHYSDLTPGSPGEPGWVEVAWPLVPTRIEPPNTGVKMGPDYEP